MSPGSLLLIFIVSLLSEPFLKPLKSFFRTDLGLVAKLLTGSGNVEPMAGGQFFCQETRHGRLSPESQGPVHDLA